MFEKNQRVKQEIKISDVVSDKDQEFYHNFVPPMYSRILNTIYFDIHHHLRKLK